MAYIRSSQRHHLRSPGFLSLPKDRFEDKKKKKRVHSVARRFRFRSFVEVDSQVVCGSGARCCRLANYLPFRTFEKKGIKGGKDTVYGCNICAANLKFHLKIKDDFVRSAAARRARQMVVTENGKIL